MWAKSGGVCSCQRAKLRHDKTKEARSQRRNAFFKNQTEIRFKNLMNFPASVPLHRRRLEMETRAENSVCVCGRRGSKFEGTEVRGQDKNSRASDKGSKHLHFD